MGGLFGLGTQPNEGAEPIVPRIKTALREDAKTDPEENRAEQRVFNATLARDGAAAGEAHEMCLDNHPR